MRLSIRPSIGFNKWHILGSYLIIFSCLDGIKQQFQNIWYSFGRRLSRNAPLLHHDVFIIESCRTYTEETCLLVSLRSLWRRGHCHLWSYRVSQERRRRVARSREVDRNFWPRVLEPLYKSFQIFILIGIWWTLRSPCCSCVLDRSCLAHQAYWCEESHLAIRRKPGHLQWPQVHELLRGLHPVKRGNSPTFWKFVQQ